MSKILLECRNMSVSYGKVPALPGIDLKVPEGEIVTVIGPNGAGKTTLLLALMGLVSSRGERFFLEQNAAKLDTAELVGAGLALVTERRELFGEMTVADNLELGAFQRARKDRAGVRADLERVYTMFPRLRERHRQLAMTLSGGERQMLALGRALMSRPKVLMLDEPSLGLAPLIVREIFQKLIDLRNDGISILLVEQNARAALDIASYGYVLEIGEVQFEGDAQSLINDPRVIECYLGLSKGKYD